MTLHADLQVARPAGFTLDVALDVAPGEVLAVLGPNGAGKTTALRALAGLLPLTAGRIQLGDDVLDDADGVFRPAERRPVGVVFQDYLLFRHLTARDNVAFGLRARGNRKAPARAAADEWLHRVGLAEHAAAKPPALSGGQAQRVALARALAVDPQLLLLDEPLAALDAATRLTVRTELGRHLADYSGHTVLVTHDPLDAMVLADRLVIVEDGQVVQHGPPADVARHPRSEYVASLVGLNFYAGTADGDRVALDGGGDVVIGQRASGRVHVAFPPSAVSLHVERPVGGPRNTWPVTVRGLEQHAHATRLQLDGTPPVLADVTAATVADLRLVPGSQLWAALKATEISVYPSG